MMHVGLGGAHHKQDANGNMTRKISGADTYDMIYDAENRLVEVKKNSVTLMTFGYDAAGQRVKSTLKGSPNDTVTRFVGSLYEYETIGTTTTTRMYYYAGSLRVAMRVGTVLTYLLGDHLGSTSLSYKSDGTETRWQLYHAWGTVRWSSGALPTKYTYTGQYSNVSEFGWMYYGARWFDPSLGRFGQSDTIVPGAGNPMTWDRYAYGLNSPIKYKDPSGHTGCTDVPTYNGIQAACNEQTPIQTGSLETLKKLIKDKFGIEITDSDAMKWGLYNLITAAQALNIINNNLNGHL